MDKKTNLIYRMLDVNWEYQTYYKMGLKFSKIDSTKDISIYFRNWEEVEKYLIENT